MDLRPANSEAIRAELAVHRRTSRAPLKKRSSLTFGTRRGVRPARGRLPLGTGHRSGVYTHTHTQGNLLRRILPAWSLSHSFFLSLAESNRIPPNVAVVFARSSPIIIRFGSLEDDGRQNPYATKTTTATGFRMCAGECFFFLLVLLLPIGGGHIFRRAGPEVRNSFVASQQQGQYKRIAASCRRFKGTVRKLASLLLGSSHSNLAPSRSRNHQLDSTVVGGLGRNKGRKVEKFLPAWEGGNFTDCEGSLLFPLYLHPENFNFP